MGAVPRFVPTREVPAGQRIPSWQRPVRDCVIIAAGRGSRMGEATLPKPLTPVLGVPLIERVILTAREAGAQRFVVVTGFAREQLEPFLIRLASRRSLPLETLWNADWHLENGASLLVARFRVRRPFLLLMGDHLYRVSLLRELLRVPLGEDEIVLAVDPQTTGNRFVDPEDATRVRLQGERILAIEKQLSPFDAYDTGAFLCSARVFTRLEETLRNGQSSLSAGVRLAAQAGRARARVVPPGSWIDIDDRRQLEKAATFLLEGLPKAADGPVSRYLNRPVSLRLSRVLAGRRVRPNLISLASFLLALAGAALFLRSGYLSLLLGGLLVQAASILDGSDGEVARLLERTSEFGGRFDQVLDRYADALVLLGLTYHAAAGSPGWFPLLVGFFALVGSLLSSYTASWYDELAEGQRHWLAGRVPRLGRDVRLLFVFLGALANAPLAALLLIAVLMNLDVLRRLLVLYSSRA